MGPVSLSELMSLRLVKDYTSKKGEIQRPTAGEYAESKRTWNTQS